MLKNLRKVIQKRVYDILSHKYGIFMVIAAAVILIVAALHFGEVRKPLFLFFRRGRWHCVMCDKCFKFTNIHFFEIVTENCNKFACAVC